MNYLQLCQRTVREAGISSSTTGPTAVTNQTGEMRRVVDWVASAYDEICTLHPNWRFLRSSFTVNTANGTQNYAPSDCTDTRLSTSITADSFSYWWQDSFRIYLSADGVSTQVPIPDYDYEDFRNIWLIRSPILGRPTHFAVRPDDNSIMPGPIPNDVYVITGDYQRVATALAADADTPLIPARFHMAIVWKAVQSYALYEEVGGLLAKAEQNYSALLTQLETLWLPPVGIAPPLA